MKQRFSDTGGKEVQDYGPRETGSKQGGYKSSLACFQEAFSRL